MTEFGRKLIINGDVKYIGDGEDPAENPIMIAYSKALKEVYQPERLSEKTYYRNEDGSYPHLEPVIGCDSLNTMET